MKVLSAIATGVMLAWPAAAAPNPIHPRTISTSVFDNLNLFAQYSAAAYCAPNINTTGTALACSVGNCPAVESADTTILYGFNDSWGFGDAAGYIAVDKSNGYIVVGFRGSHTLPNWLADLDILLVDASSICPGCQIHQGFWNTWKAVASNVTSQVQSVISAYPGYTLVVTGHSLGASLAAIAATVFRASGIAVQLYNYGQPRIGNLALINYITSTETSNNTYRVTHSVDVVPRLPPKILGYHHFGPEYWITSDNNVTVRESDVVQVVGIDSTGGNGGTITSSNTAHYWYFGPITICP
ncbi:hypothetical protein TMatcc_005126 [Talaromyces marneffei ATCC 18224]|uniref:Extracellular lipase, putative n=2 Tax=Talaromyces marneffei TaxID=37727 RepID=B6QCE2_TALMQ|nr:uncharacterized protein EYB26_006302 [Talaromyces marneffei]EEA26597.1 extracellular lipase, putative [Talaromyces marneffei ATCC 18224]KAE8555277.1 hypothetical protein EYB25_003825 [Talaromyces marneffei]QGA18617.1 hypothetical protein EYB26_006302 [Talaromyces marneffei]